LQNINIYNNLIIPKKTLRGGTKMFGELTFLQMLGLAFFLVLGFAVMVVPMKKKSKFFDRFVFEDSEKPREQAPMQ